MTRQQGHMAFLYSQEHPALNPIRYPKTELDIFCCFRKSRILFVYAAQLLLLQSPNREENNPRTIAAEEEQEELMLLLQYLFAMSFLLDYSEHLLSKLIFHTFSLLGLIQYLIYCLIGHLGFAHLLEPDVSWPDHPSHLPQFQSFSAILIRQALPVVRFEELREGDDPESCAVCLNEFKGTEEIRPLTNCPHIFHRTCLDHWLDQDQKTCPLCRALFVPEELHENFYVHFWTATEIPDYYGEYSSSSSA